MAGSDRLGPNGLLVPDELLEPLLQPISEHRHVLPDGEANDYCRVRK
jgi:hypothetical protein